MKKGQAVERLIGRYSFRKNKPAVSYMFLLYCERIFRINTVTNTNRIHFQTLKNLPNDRHCFTAFVNSAIVYLVSVNPVI